MGLGKNNRRDFLKASTLAGVGFWVSGTRAEESKSPNERIRFACIGTDGKGGSDMGDAAKNGDIVAVCDVDDKKLDAAGKKHKDAKKFNDFRKLIDEMKDNFDAVTVSTPDHNHAAASILAMKAKKGCFCQKPLTRTIYEARQMAEIAKQMGVATQMGNQGTAGDKLRETAAIVTSGVLGDVKEVHVWTNRPIWPQGGKRPEPAECPKELHWDLWLGVAKERPYANGYHPFKWRGYWDFGSGALGDMACHTVNMPYMALALKNPTSVVAETSGHNGETYPNWSMITFEFPANDKRPAVMFKWYDGGKHPPYELMEGRDPKRFNKKDGTPDMASGCLIIGTKGKLLAPGDYCEKGLDLCGLQTPKVEYVKSPGHFEEYARAIKGGEAAMSNFPGYSGGLTETILLGNLAVWAAPEAGAVGKKIEWDAKNLVATNAPEVMKIVKPEYSKGYEGILS